MKVTIEADGFLEIFDVPDGQGVRLEAVRKDSHVGGLRVYGKDDQGETLLGSCKLVCGMVDDCECLDDVVSMAVEDPEFGGCGLRAIRVGDYTYFERR